MRARVPGLKMLGLYKLGDVFFSPGINLVAGRSLTAVPVLFVVSLVTFFIVNVLPGSTAVQLAGANATREQVARLEAVLGLDRPAWERYEEWLTSMLSGDLGKSLASGQSVTALVGERLPVTLELTALALFLAVATSVPLALLAARRPFGLWDRFGMTLGVSGLSLASYILAPVLILLFSVQLGVLPSFGFAPVSESLYQNLRSLALPTVAVAFPLIGLYTRFLRGDLLEQINDQGYVLAATAKGVGPWRVLIRHALPNSLFGLLTLIGLNLGGLIGGAVIIEQIFALPGLGQLLLQSVNLRDVTVVQAIVLLLAAVTVMVNLLVDIMYATLDPRVRHGRR